MHVQGRTFRYLGKSSIKKKINITHNFITKWCPIIFPFKTWGRSRFIVLYTVLVIWFRFSAVAPLTFGQDNALLCGERVACVEPDVNLHPWPLSLKASSTPLPSCENQKCLQTLPNALWWVESPLLENLWGNVILWTFFPISLIITDNTHVIDMPCFLYAWHFLLAV